MPRRQFVADLQEAIHTIPVTGISDVQSGSDDGEFTFTYNVGGFDLRISVLIPDLSDYPTSHDSMIFGPEDAPVSFANVLSNISAAGKTVSQTMELISRKLSANGDDDVHMLESPPSERVDDSDDIAELSGQSDDDDDEFGYDYEGDAGGYFPADVHDPDSNNESDNEVLEEIILSPPADHKTPGPEFRDRVRRDLLAAKGSGFKIGHLGGLLDGWSSYVSVSVRITKLGISEEAMRAWDLQPNDYLIALFSYPSGYKTVDDIRSYSASETRDYFGIRVGLSKNYKPTLQEAVDAFTPVTKTPEKRQDKVQPQDQSTTHAGFRHTFISSPLKDLLNQQFPTLLRYRYAGMPWCGAEALYSNQSSRALQSADEHDDNYYVAEKTSGAYPPIITADHIQDATGSEHSLPLIAMQFVLRRFVRCTEFCLVCFTKIQTEIRALKPYVCDSPLCLYQYISLGFGPSMEHEILTQPQVVDLLIGFCYSSAWEGTLKDFPTGLCLEIPSQHWRRTPQLLSRVPTSKSSPPPLVVPPCTAKPTPPPPELGAVYLPDSNELLFKDSTASCPVKTGDWMVVVTRNETAKPFHCRVTDISHYPNVSLNDPMRPMDPRLNLMPDSYYQDKPRPVRVENPTGNVITPTDAVLFIYNQNFDDLEENAKRTVLLDLLNLLPSVKDMQEHLSQSPCALLSSLVDRVPPAALGVLRWIIASNRACILQVDDENDSSKSHNSSRIHGMPGWAQFKFAMGAPHKERQFIQAVQSTSKRLKLKVPTLFAWHGSAMKNWHSIIREGLHFDTVVNGRSYGHGVYHSLDARVSVGYTTASSTTDWPGSGLKIQNAMALNEIVCAPQEFVSSQPHLVVSQLDWIQTRYLFVKLRLTGAQLEKKTNSSVPLDALLQDPKWTPNGLDGSVSGGKLVIPSSAISSRRYWTANGVQAKRQKTTSGIKYDISVDDNDDTASVATLDMDREIFENDDYTAGSSKDSLAIKPTKPNSTGSKDINGFVPGSLDYGTLPLLEQPAWASNIATHRLMQDFRKLVKTQKQETSADLGWYIDAEKTENLYQWIVELHSFDTELPLAKDMKKADIKSVVLELRFGKDYPMSPPFVRVIRPRFLSFHEGGGGNVTSGGAMCMELLTNDGWSSVASMDVVLLQVRLAITNTERYARLELRGHRMDYGVGEAVEAYIRACKIHGWTVPRGFEETARGGGVSKAGTNYQGFKPQML